MNRRYSFSVDDDSDKTVNRYEQFISGSSTSGYFDVEEFETIAEYYLRKGRTKDCSTALDFGLQQHPNNSSLRSKRAKLYLVMGDALKAYRILETLTEKNDYDIILLKIESLLKLERTQEAKELSGSLFKTTNLNDIDYTALDIAFIYMNQRKFETALQYLKKGNEKNPKNIDILFEMAYCYEQVGDFDQAIASHEQIISIDAFVSEAWFNLGQIYFSLLQFTKALEAYDYVLAIDPTDSFACLQKAHILLQLQQYEDAIECYKEYGEMSNDSSQIDIYIAECYEKLEKFEEAINYYEKTLFSSPDSYDALTGIAICLLELEKFEESIPYIQEALKLQPTAADAWVYMAEAYVGLEDNDNATVAYLKALEYDPQQPETLLAIGNLYFEKADYQSALKYYYSAYEQNKDLEHINLFLAVAYFKTGEITLGLDYLQEAVDVDENAVSLFLELCPEAITLARTNNPENNESK